MFEARVNGVNIRPEDYSEDLHKGKLCCPDPQCSATVHYVSESEGVDGSQTSRAAHFATNRGEEHAAGCEVKKYEAACHRAVVSIENGGFVLFNLNVIPKQATTRFNDNARSKLVRGLIEAKADWAEANRSVFKTISIKNVGDLVRVLDHIEEKHGKKGLDNCFFNSGGFIMHHSRVDLRNNPDAVQQLYKDMVTSERPNNKGHVISKPHFSEKTWYFGFPRLITVSGLHTQGRNVAGAEETLLTNTSRKTFRQVIKPKSHDGSLTRHDLLNGSDCTLISSPHLCIEDEKFALNHPQGKPSLSWSLHDGRQFFTTATPPLDSPKVETEPSGQMGWRWNRQVG
ncbi:MAG: hypothetical protein ACPG05_00305 [Bdellovibrionales bacterium]